MKDSHEPVLYLGKCLHQLWITREKQFTWERQVSSGCPEQRDTSEEARYLRLNTIIHSVAVQCLEDPGSLTYGRILKLFQIFGRRPLQDSTAQKYEGSVHGLSGFRSH